MGRLSLVIADYDAEYIRNLEKYLIINYPRRFELISFSSSQSLYDFLESQAPADIILVNSRMYDERIGQYSRGLVLFLMESNSEPVLQCPGPAVGPVMKYQHADKLVSEVLRLYTADTDRGHLMPGRRNTCIVSVASPAGGVGQSSIAAGCSILCAGRGLRTFYLNLENIPSTDRFFRGESDQSFSNVLYHLKGSGSIQLRLESAKCKDIRSGVHFFKPPESILEMNEFEEQDAVRLIREFRSNCMYDMVFIDMPSGLTDINTEVMRHSDTILLVLVRDPVMEPKADAFSRALDQLVCRKKPGLADKLLPILNFSAGSADCGPVYGFRPAAVIADCSRTHDGNTAGCLTGDVTFLASLNSIVDQILADRSVACISLNGGGSAAGDRSAAWGGVFAGVGSVEGGGYLAGSC